MVPDTTPVPMGRPAWRGRRVLVTGATGMVGSWLVKELVASEAIVVALVVDADPQSELHRSGADRRITIVNGALEDMTALERAVNRWEPEVVFHLGAQTLVGAAHRAPWSTFQTNITGTYNLLETCRQQAPGLSAVVVASSDKAYGEHSRPYTEDMPLQGRHPYEVSKSCADLLSQCYAHTYGLPVAIARCGNIYGGGDLNWSRLVPETIRAFLENRSPVIRSDGTFVRDYIYVRDAANAYLDLAERVGTDGSMAGEAFNFSDERQLTVLEMVEAIQTLMGRPDLKPDVRNRAVGEIPSQRLSAAKARNVLGWKPRFTLEEGLAETIGWYRELLANDGDVHA
jgi:CDP-glucose 4,6-dehydratase